MGIKYLGRQRHEAGEALVGDDDCVREAIGRVSVGNLCKMLQNYTRGSMPPTIPLWCLKTPTAMKLPLMVA
jgi:hypothetical protein